MTTVDSTIGYGLDRKAASRLMKVSIRTLDRYISGKKLSTRIVDGRIWLEKGEVESFKRKKEKITSVDSVDMSIPRMSIDNNVDNVDKVEVFDEDYVNRASTQRRERTGQSGEIYKKLYEELKNEVDEQQKRLEIANYRVGQLSAQVKNSIPMLEYHRENYEKRQREENLKLKLEDENAQKENLILELKYEKFNKRVFLVILLTILALQPLWILLRYQ